MRRWFPAIAASLLFHLLLLLIPASLPEASESLPPLRLVLRRLKPQGTDIAVNSEITVPDVTSPVEKLAALPKPPYPAVSREVPKERPPVEKAEKKTVLQRKKKSSPEKTPAPAPSISAPSKALSVPQETAETGGGKREEISNPTSPGKATKPVDGETLSIVKRIVPTYPRFSRKRGEEGSAVILVTIESGRVTEGEIEKSSGFTRLDAAALQAARLWIFQKNVTVRARIPFLFQLAK